MTKQISIILAFFLCLFMVVVGIVLAATTPILQPDYTRFMISDLNLWTFLPDQPLSNPNPTKKQVLKQFSITEKQFRQKQKQSRQGRRNERTQTSEDSLKPSTIVANNQLYDIYIDQWTNANLQFRSRLRHLKCVTVYVGGYGHFGAKNNWSAYQSLLSSGNNMGGGVVTFDMMCDKVSNYRRFNFCQEGDADCIRLVLMHILAYIGSNTKVYLYGESKGGLAILNFLIYQKQRNDPEKLLPRINACTIASPVVSLQKSITGISWFGPYVYWCGSRWMPSYESRRNPILDPVVFPSDIPVLIATLPNDASVTLKDLTEMYRRLKQKTGKANRINRINRMFLFVSKRKDLRHGLIIFDSAYNQYVQAFLSHVQLSPNALKLKSEEDFTKTRKTLST